MSKSGYSFLVNHGISPSVQRLAIIEYLLSNQTHPTVDEVYRSLHFRIPTLSKTTVYNTLNLFVKKGIVALVSIDECNARYDACTDLHAHFKCKTCGCIFDISIPDLQNLLNQRTDLIIEEAQINLKGLCRKCFIVE